MSVCVGGFHGSGRNRLAAALSRALGDRYFSTEELAENPLFMQQHVLTRSEKETGFSDEILLRIYRKVAADFKLDSKMHPDMVIQDCFTREIPREFLFAEVDKYFGPPLIIWIDSTREEEIKRLHQMFSSNEKKLKSILALSADIRAHFQPFTRPVQTIHYWGNPNALEQAVAFVRARRRL
jgi:hypothetical protein